MHMQNNPSYPPLTILCRSAEDYEAMYNQNIRYAPPVLARSSSPSSSEADVSDPALAPTPQSTPTPSAPLEDILDDPEFDQISDQEDIVEDYAVWRRDPAAVRRRAMAEDFREGHLETLVDSPQKELAGTQNQYVSYQVTTKVRAHACSFLERSEP
jgi:sorting nexin-4